ncbi:MAG TPA: BTAD domain-containing putative transcriptional regulator, partial [Gemmatimonadales bacterium]|nr:BTAD domain-containing putative transcriptional regulator [Gemmatimonadales bacterium]
MRFRLQLFGSPSLAGEDGTPLAGRAAQRHRLALLALLALSGRRGVRRDKLQALLWPESDTEHARPLLNQAVYSLRKALGEEAILSIGEELRFNAQVVSCDVLAFEEALAAGEPERAVGLYGGPVLDGLFLTDAPEFEHWLDGERARLAQAHAKALELLAETAEGQGAFSRAAEWWKARAVHDPYDSRVALRLMLALSASGNRAGAIQHAAIHQRLLQQEFDTGPDPQVLALAERLRSEPAGGMDPQPNVLSTSASPLPGPPSPPPTAPALGRQGPRTDARVALPAPPRQRGRRYRLAALGAGLLVVLAVWLGSRGARVPPAAGTPSIAVLPLQDLSPDPQDSMLADGMTDALIAMLARSGGIRVTASTSVFALRDQPVDVRRIADTLKVENLLAGSFQRLGSRLRVRVRLIDATDASTRWSESYDREFVDILAVQDEIA